MPAGGDLDRLQHAHGLLPVGECCLRRLVVGEDRDEDEKRDGQDHDLLGYSVGNLGSDLAGNGVRPSSSSSTLTPALAMAAVNAVASLTRRPLSRAEARAVQAARATRAA